MTVKVPYIVGVGLSLGLLIALSSCQNSSERLIRLLRQDPLIQAYFNHNRGATKYSDPYRQIEREGDNLENVVIEAIAQAESTIEVAVQELRLPEIALALARKQQAGVKVRVIVDNNYSRPLSQLTSAEVSQLDSRDRTSYQEFFTLVDLNRDGRLSKSEIERRDALVILSKAGVPLLDDTADGSKGAGLMHHKFVIVDDRLVITGSANFTLSGMHGDFANPESRGNANSLLQIHSPQLAALFVEEFNYMWGDGVGKQLDSRFGLAKPWRPSRKIYLGDSTIKVVFSPTSRQKEWKVSTNGQIAAVLASATQSIKLALFVFSEQKIADVLAQHQQKVEIKALVDPGFAFRYYSELLDLLGVAMFHRCKYEADNQPWRSPLTTAGVPNLARGDKLHHKFAIVDRHTLIVGSHNWSAAANFQNDEAVLIIRNATVAAHFQREFDSLYSSSHLGVPAAIAQKIARQQRECNLSRLSSQQ